MAEEALNRNLEDAHGSLPRLLESLSGSQCGLGTRVDRITGGAEETAVRKQTHT